MNLGNKVTAIGDINIDIIINYDQQNQDQEIEKAINAYCISVGGSTFNSSIVLSTLGMDVEFYGIIGKNFPQYYISEMKTMFSKIHLERSKKDNGLVLSLSNDNDRKLLSYRGSNRENIKSLPKRGDILLLSTYFFLDHSYEHIDNFKTKILSVGDSNIDIDNKLLKKFDFIFMNENHFNKNKDLSKDIRSKEIIITLGEKGCIVLKNGKKHFKDQTNKVTVKDTTGAGDAFLAGYVYSRIGKGRSIEESMHFANYCGSVAVNIFGTGFKFKDKKFKFSNI